MITFGEWHKFNFVDNKIMQMGDIFVKVFRKHSFKSDDKCLEGLMRLEDAVKMFGDYTLFNINYHTIPRDSTREFDYKCLCAMIYREEIQ